MGTGHPQHGPRSHVLTLLATCLATSECYSAPEFGGEEIEILALDTRIDRPRILAVSTSPFVVRPGEVFVLDALALAPGNIDTWLVEGAGWGEDRPIDGDPTEAFLVPDLVDTLGTTMPLELVAPQWTTDGFEACMEPEQWDPPGGDPTQEPEPPSTCAAGLAIRITVQSETRAAVAVTEIPVQIGPWGGPASPPLQSTPPTLDAVTAEAGQTVEVGLSMPIPADLTTPDGVYVRWYADSGTFLASGTTGVALDETGLRARNEYVVPESAGGWRIASVVAAPRPAAVGTIVNDLGWTVSAVEEAP